MRPQIVCLGEPLIELNERGAPGTYAKGYGGDTSNCAIAAARQGASVGYVSAVGEDSFGDDLLALWASEGVDATHVARNRNAPTGIYLVSHGADGHRFSYYRSGSAASLMTPEKLPEEYLKHASILHVSGISQAISTSACDAVFGAIEIVRGGGGRISYDPNFRASLWSRTRARTIVTATASMSDYFLPGLEDARTLTGLSEPDAILDHYLGAGAKLVALTLGHEGVYLADREQRHRIPPHRVESVDATGAGDVFDGAFLTRLATGDDPLTAATYANVAAALATTGFGAVAPIPAKADVVAALGQV